LTSQEQIIISALDHLEKTNKLLQDDEDELDEEEDND
jgi:hypothetical protein